MIQEIGAERFDNSYITDAEPTAADTLFCFRGMYVMASEDTDSLFPRVDEVTHSGEALYLFSIGSRRFFLTLDEKAAAPEKYAPVNVRQLRRRPDIDKVELFAMFTAFHLYKWYSSGRFCGACGAPAALDTDICAGIDDQMTDTALEAEDNTDERNEKMDTFNEDII